MRNVFLSQSSALLATAVVASRALPSQGREGRSSQAHRGTLHPKDVERVVRQRKHKLSLVRLQSRAPTTHKQILQGKIIASIQVKAHPRYLSNKPKRNPKPPRHLSLCHETKKLQKVIKTLPQFPNPSAQSSSISNSP